MAVANILLVEDEEQVRVLAESFLQTAGHTTCQLDLAIRLWLCLKRSNRSTCYSST